MPKEQEHDTELFIRSAEYLQGIQARLTETPRLVIVEDSQADALLLLHQLEPFDVHVKICYDPKEALARMKAKEFDLAFVDIKMPLITGDEMLQELIGVRTGCEYIYVTGYPDAAIKSNAVRSGALLVLPKPISRDKLALLFRAK